jgi:hypothetical protein
MISFAKADGYYTPGEEAKIKGIASFTLNHVVDYVARAGKYGHDITGQVFLDSSSIGNKLQESVSRPNL